MRTSHFFTFFFVLEFIPKNSLYNSCFRVFHIIVPPRRAIRGQPKSKKIEEQDLPNALDVQPQREVTNAMFREAIRMISQVLSNQVGQQRGAQQKEANTWRVHEFLRMNPPSFTGLTTTEDPKNF